ncbi:hypothetical protein BDW74DRAFT_179086 [Aspergillus multicolor]|uniref:uncharacterized protein n=1 Tax=Aspergillus multicolor TaxID=41759 RepID=UPI003CCDFC74
MTTSITDRVLVDPLRHLLVQDLPVRDQVHAKVPQSREWIPGADISRVIVHHRLPHGLEIRPQRSVEAHLVPRATMPHNAPAEVTHFTACPIATVQEEQELCECNRTRDPNCLRVSPGAARSGGACGEQPGGIVGKPDKAGVIVAWIILQNWNPPKDLTLLVQG